MIEKGGKEMGKEGQRIGFSNPFKSILHIFSVDQNDNPDAVVAAADHRPGDPDGARLEPEHRHQG